MAPFPNPFQTISDAFPTHFQPISSVSAASSSATAPPWAWPCPASTQALPKHLHTTHRILVSTRGSSTSNPAGSPWARAPSPTTTTAPRPCPPQVRILFANGHLYGHPKHVKYALAAGMYTSWHLHFYKNVSKNVSENVSIRHLN